MLNLILTHLATLIFVVTLGKQFVDRKCQENFDVGVRWGIELHKIELQKESNEIYRKIMEE